MGVDVNSLTTGEKVAGGAGVVTAIAAFLTWVDAGIATVAGTSGDGVFTLIFGSGVAAIVLFRDWNTIDMAATGILGLLTAVIALNVYGNLDAQANQTVISATAGIGLHLTLIGGLALLTAAGYGFVKER